MSKVRERVNSEGGAKWQRLKDCRRCRLKVDDFALLYAGEWSADAKYYAQTWSFIGGWSRRSSMRLTVKERKGCGCGEISWSPVSDTPACVSFIRLLFSLCQNAGPPIQHLDASPTFTFNHTFFLSSATAYIVMIFDLSIFAREYLATKQHALILIDLSIKTPC